MELVKDLKLLIFQKDFRNFLYYLVLQEFDTVLLMFVSLYWLENFKFGKFGFQKFEFEKSEEKSIKKMSLLKAFYLLILNCDEPIDTRQRE